MKTVSKSELKAHMLEYFREVERTGEELVVLDRHVPVLKVVPIQKKRSVDEVFGRHRGNVRYAEDLTAPTLDQWPES